jgi:colanic acid biosynthesis protein WcaH
MEISNDQLLKVIENTPLVSIDLIVKNKEEKILLGIRKNEPAKNTWFVPGGRVRKDEDLDIAFTRITKNELGLDCTRDQAHFIGIFEHKYTTNFLERPGISTHYIVIAYEIKPLTNPENFYNIQHQEYRWFSANDALKDNSNVHQNAQLYFKQRLTDDQNKSLNARRDSFQE